MQPIDDIRVLLSQCKNDPSRVKHFAVDQTFIDELELLISKRSGAHTEFKADQFTTDYTLIENYRPDLQFDAAIHKKYLKHLPIENLHGLTIDSIVPWEVGSVITFDRTQIHCAGFGHKRKMGITFFTSLA